MASIAGLVVVGFSWLAESECEQFKRIAALACWSPVTSTPLLCAAIVWATRRFARGAGGSCIPPWLPRRSGIMFVIEELSPAPE
jgi:H+/Cl- antiporter ClcA